MSFSRVSNSQMMQKVLLNLQLHMKSQGDIYQKISSNKRVESPSDDPESIGKILQIRDKLIQNEEFSDTINKATTINNVISSTIDNTMSAWGRINEIAVSASDDSKSSYDRQILADELDELFQHVIQLANSSYEGRYIFAGSKTNEPPFAVEKDLESGEVSNVFYLGDSKENTVRCGENSNVTTNILGGSGGNPKSHGMFVDSNEGIDVFKTILDLKKKILDNDIDKISNAGGSIDEIGRINENFIRIQSKVSSRQQVIDANGDKLTASAEVLSDRLSQMEDADLAQLMLELNLVQTTYEAALQSGAQIMSISLLDFI